MLLKCGGKINLNIEFYYLVRLLIKNKGGGERFKMCKVSIFPESYWKTSFTKIRV